MKNEVELFNGFVELTSSELEEVEGGGHKVWYALGYVLSWLCDSHYQQNETLMNCI